MRRKRPLNVFTLSFLDVMAGGFGAVVMIFLIINHATEEAKQTTNRDQLSEARLLDYQQTVGLENLANLRELVGTLRLRIADAREKVIRLREDVEEQQEEVEEIEKIALDQSEVLERLKSEVETQETEVQRLQKNEDTRGPQTIEIAGEGDRQYLTGLFMGGNYIVVALDSSASMLDKSIVNVLRRRNMSVERQLEAPKWQRAVNTVAWLVANIPIESKFQIATYNEQAKFIVGDGKWQAATESKLIFEALDELRKQPPTGGTNLESLFLELALMSPLPDNLFLITDGLPTLESGVSRRTKVTGRQRLAIFRRSVRNLPGGIPVNVIMFPLEGDPHSAGSYWNLAHITAGTFMAPSEDWP